MTERVVIGNAELWHGDCREVLPLLPDFDLILTDPPYGLNAAVNQANERIVGDETVDIRNEVMKLARARSGVWFGSPKCEKPNGVHITLVWDKGVYVGMGDLKFPFKLTHEEIYIVGDKALWAGKRQESVLRDPALYPNLPAANEARGESLVHPTQKPIGLIERLLRMTTAQTVIDPFMGSGTTGVACVRVGRLFTGIERERKYFDIACERISRAQAQGQMFPVEESKPEQLTL